MESCTIPGSNSCPVCGGGDRIVETKVKELKEEKKVEQNIPEGIVIPIPLTTQNQIFSGIVPMARMLAIFLDVCSNCKAVYCTKIEYAEIRVKVGAPPKQGAPPMLPIDFQGGSTRPR